MGVPMADSKQDVLDMLAELAELTILDEGDPQSFRVRAYENAAHGIGGSAGVLIMFIVVAAGGAAFYWQSRKTAVTSKNVNDDWVGTVAPPAPKTPVPV